MRVTVKVTFAVGVTISVRVTVAAMTGVTIVDTDRVTVGLKITIKVGATGTAAVTDCGEIYGLGNGHGYSYG